MLWDQAESSNYFRQKVLSLVSHELAHFWFGNLVTNEWWDNLFLNEGFASYFEYFIPASVSISSIKQSLSEGKMISSNAPDFNEH